MSGAAVDWLVLSATLGEGGLMISSHYQEFMLLIKLDPREATIFTFVNINLTFNVSMKVEV